MWMDFINFIIKVFSSILIVITVIFLTFLYFENNGYSKIETKQKLLLLKKLFFIIIYIISFLIFIILILYKFI